MSKQLLNIGLMLILLFSCNNSEEENSSVSIPGSEINITPANVRNFMVDPAATQETVALFYNLNKNAGSKILIGHHDAFSSFYQNDNSESDVKKTTNSDPAMLSLDFMFITDDDNDGTPSNWYYQQEQNIIANAKKAYNSGMAVTFCWHFREPYQGNSFYTSEMTEYQKQNALKSILPGGENNQYYLNKLNKIASVLNNLCGNDNKLIPVIFRPFHEFDGNWFWWGANYCTSSQFIQLWQSTVSYLRDTKNVHNVLYAFSPDASLDTTSKYLERYPGDKYVDILGMDNYSDFYNQNSVGVTSANNKLKIISELAKTKNKISALTETGYSSTNTTPRISNYFTNLLYPAITNNGVKISYVCFWANSQAEYYVPTPATAYYSDFNVFAQYSNLVLQNNISSIYSISQ